MSAVKKVTDIVAEIAAATREQSAGIDQVNKAVMAMDGTTQQNAALVEEAAAASQAIVEQAQALNEIVGRYKVIENLLGWPGDRGAMRQSRSQVRRKSRGNAASPVATGNGKSFSCPTRR